MRNVRNARQVIAWFAVLSIAAAVTTAAVQADGREGTETTTNDGGAWLLNRSESSVGHVNRVVGEVDSVAGPFTGTFEITQARNVVVVTDRTLGKAVLIDTKLSAPGATIAVRSTTTVTAVPDGVVAYDSASGRLWRVSRDTFGTVVSLDEVDADLELSPPGAIAAGLDGRVIAVTGDGATAFVAAEGEDWKSFKLKADANNAGTNRQDSPPTSEDADVLSSADDAANVVLAATVVGSTYVVLEESGNLIVIDGDKSHEVSVPNAVNLQQPSLDLPGVVVVHEDGSMATVDLHGGDVVDSKVLSSTTIRPIAHRGCIWSITTAPDTLHYCDRDAILGQGSGEYELVLVNGWVWVNDVNLGGVWFVSDESLEINEVSDWTAALLQNDQLQTTDDAGGGKEEIVHNANAAELLDDANQVDEDGVEEPPIAVDDDAATRKGRPIVVSVLANDSDPDHDPLTVIGLQDVDVHGLTADNASVTISADGSTVQVSPDVDFIGDIHFGYSISDGRGGEASAKVTVSVTEPDQATNRAPFTTVDNATVRAGESVSLNVIANDNDPDGDVLVLTGVDQPGGAIGFTPDGEVQYAPEASSPEGLVEIAYTVVDDFNAEAKGLIRVRVRPADSNQPPRARNDVARGALGRSITLNVLRNDSDADGDPLIAQNLQTSDGTSTTAKLGPDGVFIFRPETAGVFRFTYSVSDGPTVSTGQIVVTATDDTENHPPVAIADQVALAIGESRLVRVLINDGDPDGDVVGLVDWVGVDGLDISEVPGIGFTVTALPTANPRTQFRYWISDGVNDRVMGTVVVSAIPREAVDYPPIAVVDTVDARAGVTTKLNVLRNDHDPEGKYLELVGPTVSPLEALVRISPDKQTLLMTVNQDQKFGFTFSYDVVDPAGNRGSAVVQVRVVPASAPNRAPVAAPDVATTPYATGVTFDVLANDFDPDGDLIAVESIAEQPAHGSIEILPDGKVKYTPRDGFSGTDHFVYTLVDGYQPPLDANGQPTVDSGPARDRGEVLIGVMSPAPANRAPTAVADDNFAKVGLSTSPVALDVLANDTDPDNDPLTVVAVTPPSVGSVVVAQDRSNVVFTPPATGQPQQVSFGYTISDGRGGTNSSTVTLDLVEAPEPVAPIAVDDSVGPVKANALVTIDPRTNDLDPDGDASLLTVEATDPALRLLPDGTLEITAPPTTQEFRYRVQDQQGLWSEPAVISVIVANNQAPAISPIAVETPYNTPVTIDVGAATIDPDNDPLVITLGRQRVGGSTQTTNSASGLTVVFTPDTNFVGTASFDFTVDDHNGHTVAGTVSITVQPPQNREPTAVDQTITAEAGIDSVVNLASLVTDPDGPIGHTFRVSSPSGPVKLQGPNGGTVVVKSSLSDGGSKAGFDYTVVDGPFSVTKHVTIDLIAAKFPAPTVSGDSARTLQNTATSPIPVLNNDVDHTPSGLPRELKIVAVGVSPGGTATISNGSIVFTPNPDFFGTATFNYTVQDARRSRAGEATATVSVNVIGPPGQPASPAVRSVGDKYVVVGWSAPAGDAARAPATGYVLTYTGSDGTQGSITFTEPTTSYRWDGLTNGVQYCFAVAAVNEAGTGPSSAHGGASCGTPDIRPEAPSAPTVTFGDTQLKITWAPPLNRGSPIKNYQLRISGGLQKLSADLGNTTTYAWTGLTNGTDYTFEVRAQNSAADNGGWSNWSPLSAPEHPLTVPNAPDQPAAKRGDRQVVISWTAPPNGGDAIQKYQVQSSLSPEWVDAPAQGQSNSYQWQNIPNGTNVTFKVRAVNRDPRSTTPGNISVSSPVVRTCGVPDTVATPTAARGDTTASVTWSVPNDQGCAISGYRITASNGATQTVAAGATSHVFTGLTNGTPYTFTVSAINEVVTTDGQAPRVSGASNEVIPAGPPRTTNVTSAANVGARQVTVAWDPADGNGRPVLRYELQVNNSAWTSVGNVTSVTRTEGSDGATYTYAVRAVNEIGSGSSGSTKTVTTWSAPGTPNVSTSTTTSSVTGSWSAPSNGGTELTAREAKLVAHGSDCGASGTLVGNASSPHTWSGLPQGTAYRVCVRYQNAVGWGSWGSGSATTKVPTPTITVSWGGSAKGQKGCDTDPCRYIVGSGTAFPPNTTYTVECMSNHPSGWHVYNLNNSVTTDSNGKFSFAPPSKSCYFGQTGYQVQLRVNGVESNAITVGS